MKEKGKPGYVELKDGSLTLKSVAAQDEDARILLKNDNMKVMYLSDKDGKGYASIRDGDSFQVVSLRIENDAAYVTIDPSVAVLSSHSKKEKV